MIIQGNCIEVLKTLDDELVDCCITSPPYWGLRDYGIDGQFGLEKTPEEYVAKMVAVFREVHRVLKKEGTLWLNLGDSYAMSSMRGKNSEFKTQGVGANIGYSNGIIRLGKRDIPSGLKPKDLVGIPWRVAFALQADGWYLRQDIIWSKPNPMPESVTDRCTKAHEYIFLLAKSQHYYFDNEAIKEDAVQKMPETRNKRSVWTVTTKPYREAHFATFPEQLIIPCVLAGCPKDGTVLDPFAGSGTTGAVAKKLGRNYVLIELNPKYIELIKKRLSMIPERLDMRENKCGSRDNEGDKG